MINNYLLLKLIFLRGIEACDNGDCEKLSDVLNSIIIITNEIKKYEDEVLGNELKKYEEEVL